MEQGTKPTRPICMSAVDCNIIKPSSNELHSGRHSTVLMKKNNAFLWETANDTQSYYTMPQLLVLQDQNLLGKLSTYYLIALEAKHHIQCLLSLYNRARQSKGSTEQDDTSAINQGIALAELVAYIEDTRAHNKKSF